MTESFSIEITSARTSFESPNYPFKKCPNITKKSLETYGKRMTLSGTFVTGIFYTLPVTIPAVSTLACGATIFSIFKTLTPRNSLNGNRVEQCMRSLVFATLGGTAAGAFTVNYMWDYLTGFVHTSPVARLSGIAGMGMIAVGGSLWVVSRYLKQERSRYMPINI